MVFGIPGTESITLGNWSGTFHNIGNIALLLILFAGAIYILYWAFGNKSSGGLSRKVTCVWYEEINGNMTYLGQDIANVLIIPTTNIPVLYIKKKKMYIPRPTIKMGKDLYWFVIKNNKEIVNVRLKNLNKEMAELGLDFDHTDMRYASEYLKELINTNYKDRDMPWYIRYKDTISVVIILFVMFVGGYFLISKIGTLIQTADSLVQTVMAQAERICSNPGSGIIVK